MVPFDTAPVNRALDPNSSAVDELRRDQLHVIDRLLLLSHETAMQANNVPRVVPVLSARGCPSTSMHSGSGNSSLFSLVVRPLLDASSVHQRILAMNLQNYQFISPSLRFDRSLCSFIEEEQRRKACLLLGAKSPEPFAGSTAANTTFSKSIVPLLSDLLERHSRTSSAPENDVRRGHDHEEQLDHSSEELFTSRKFEEATLKKHEKCALNLRENTTSITMENSEGRQTLREKDRKWMENLELLRRYKEENGDCIVPRGFPENPRLASWVAEQRKQYKLYKDGKQSFITLQRIRLLNELGFTWNAQDAAWSRRIAELNKFCQEHGHCHVPLHEPELRQLGLWVKTQRQHFNLWMQGKPSNMTPSRARELEEIGFCWDAHEATWVDRAKELLEFQRQFGHCNVPASFEENQRLATWVHHQRRQYKRFKDGLGSHITEERIEMLERIGFSWNINLGRTLPTCGSGNAHLDGDSSGKRSHSSYEENESESRSSRSCKRLRKGYTGEEKQNS